VRVIKEWADVNVDLVLAEHVKLPEEFENIGIAAARKS
jgi:hypothetical protein